MAAIMFKIAFSILVFLLNIYYVLLENEHLSNPAPFVYPEDVYDQVDRFTIDYVLQTVSWPFTVPDFGVNNAIGEVNSSLINKTAITDKSFRNVILETFKQSAMKQFQSENKTLQILGFDPNKDNPEDAILNWYLNDLNRTGNGLIIIKRPDNNTDLIRGKELESVLLKFIKQSISNKNRFIEIKFTRYTPEPTSTVFTTLIPDYPVEETRGSVHKIKTTQSTSSSTSTQNTKFFKIYQKSNIQRYRQTIPMNTDIDDPQLRFVRSSLFQQFTKWYNNQNAGRDGFGKNNVGRNSPNYKQMGQYYNPAAAYRQGAPNYGPAAPNYGQDGPNYEQAGPNYGNAGPNYGPAAPNYGNVDQNYGAAAPNYGNAGPNYGQAAPNYAQGAPARQSPDNKDGKDYWDEVSNYGQGIPNYGQVTKNIGQPNYGQRYVPNIGQANSNFAQGMNYPNYGQHSPVIRPGTPHKAGLQVQPLPNYRPIAKGAGAARNKQQIPSTQIAPTFNQFGPTFEPSAANNIQVTQNIGRNIPNHGQISPNIKDLANNNQILNHDQRVSAQIINTRLGGYNDVQGNQYITQAPLNIVQESEHLGQIPPNVAQEALMLSMTRGPEFYVNRIAPGQQYITKLSPNHGLWKTGQIPDPRLAGPHESATPTKGTIGVPDALKLIEANTRGIHRTSIIQEMVTKNTPGSPVRYTQRMLVYPEDLVTKYTIMDYTRQGPDDAGHDEPKYEVYEFPGHKNYKFVGESPITTTTIDAFAIGEVVFGVSITPMPSTSSQFIENIRKEMEERKTGYYTTFLLKLLEIIATARDKDAMMKLFFAAEPVVDQMMMQAEFYRYGEPFSSKFLDQARDLNGASIDVTQSMATIGYNYLLNRKTTAAADINAIFDFVDANVNEEEGKALFSALEEVKIYPNTTKTGKEVMTIVLVAALAPAKRLSWTKEGRALFDTINKAIADRTGDKIYPRAISDFNESINRKNDTRRRRIKNRIDFKTDKESRIERTHSKKTKIFKRETLTNIMTKAKKHLKNKHPEMYKKQLKHIRQLIYEQSTTKRNHESILKKIGIERKDYNYERYLKCARKKKFTNKEIYDSESNNMPKTISKSKKRFNIVHKNVAKNFYNNTTNKHYKRKEQQVTKVFRKHKSVIYYPISIRTSKRPNRAQSPLNIKNLTKQFNIKIPNKTFRKPMSFIKEFVRRFARNENKRKDNESLLKVVKESSYTDEEKELKENLKDALVHGNRNYEDFRRNVKRKEKNISNEDIEVELKKNIYRSFGFNFDI